jgi:Protein of unknown function, DUF481
MRFTGRRFSARRPARALGALLLACPGVLAAHPGPLLGQTILNTERFQLSEVRGPHLSAELAVALKRGNTRLLDVSASGVVGTLVGRHWPRLIFGGSYLSNDSRSILDDEFVQLRYSYILSPRTRTFHFLQLQRNQTLLLQRRVLVGAGIRRALVDRDDMSLSVGLGVMGQWEQLDPTRIEPGDPRREDSLRMADLAVFSRTFGAGARILDVLYVQPDLSDLGDNRILNDLGVSVPLTGALSLVTSLEWRRDTRPPSALARDDVTLHASVSVDLP